MGLWIVIVVLPVLGLAAGGCSTPHKLISARRTSCPTRDIEISDMTYSGSEEHWIASCKGRNYACSTREVGRRLAYRCVLKEGSAQVVEARGAAREPIKDAGTP